MSNVLRLAAPAIILFLVQIPIAWGLVIAGIGSTKMWTMDTGVWDLPVSLTTKYASLYGFVIPVLFGACCVVLGCVALLRERNSLRWAFGLATAEAVLLGLHSFALFEQAKRLMFKSGHIGGA